LQIPHARLGRRHAWALWLKLPFAA